MLFLNFSHSELRMEYLWGSVRFALGGVDIFLGEIQKYQSNEKSDQTNLIVVIHNSQLW